MPESESFVELEPGAVVEYTRKGRFLILFYKQRCPNCVVMKKVLQKCLKADPGIRAAVVDIEKEAGFLDSFDVGKVPTLIVFQDGNAISRRTGVMRPDELRAFYFGT